MNCERWVFVNDQYEYEDVLSWFTQLFWGRQLGVVTSLGEVVFIKQRHRAHLRGGLAQRFLPLKVWITHYSGGPRATSSTAGAVLRFWWGLEPTSTRNFASFYRRCAFETFSFLSNILNSNFDYFSIKSDTNVGKYCTAFIYSLYFFQNLNSCHASFFMPDERRPLNKKQKL